MPSIIVRTKEAGMAGYPVVRTLECCMHDLPCPDTLACALQRRPAGAGGLLHLRSYVVARGRRFELRRRVCMHEDTRRGRVRGEMQQPRKQPRNQPF